VNAPIAIAALTPVAVLVGETAPDLAAYDCVGEDGATTPADRLAQEGFQILSVGRFGQPNVMMVHPETKVRVNCIVRREGPK
jgi:hypothetical protein